MLRARLLLCAMLGCAGCGRMGFDSVDRDAGRVAPGMDAATDAASADATLPVGDAGASSMDGGLGEGGIVLVDAGVAPDAASADAGPDARVVSYDAGRAMVCTGASCSCTGTDNCTFGCPTGDCSFSCSSTSDCSADCRFPGSTCSMDCSGLACCRLDCLLDSCNLSAPPDVRATCVAGHCVRG